ncbi:penicillin-binding protein 2A [Evansella caseinilytica]|uniref:Penicillin-binding protein 2A n=1 Tax=Evansella caseinilytica TaxID=1503961 RepID=A0A1H3K3N9_9BACI|nr:PBP1A family penicillin-binding protein [Evansella caseinilytica]SDY46439.1 penicillin-binding protein 2A [Evansella caseinilytica]
MLKKRIIFSAVFIIGIFIAGFSVYLGTILFGNYAIDNKDLVMNASTTIESSDGELISKLYVENRELISLDDVPEHVRNAFIAVEDHRFYEHQGIDFRAIGRALYRDIITGSKAEGGSTITQQLAKNIFLSHDKTWLRKTKEVLMAVNLERRYSKDDILEMYLNNIYFGHGAYGIQTASLFYFDKPVNELTIEEGALLAALPKAPNYYSPINHPDRAKERRDVVLSVMERRGYLTAEEMVRLQGRTVAVQAKPLAENDAYLSYIDLVLDEAERLYHLSQEELLKGGYRIVVEMDPQIQQVVYDAFQEEANFPAVSGEEPAEAGFVLMDHQTGGVVAAQGGRTYVRRGFNRVTAARQPGSVFKPLAVYAPALDTGSYQPYSLLKDELIDYDGYVPGNYTHHYQGEMTMYDAVKESANAPAVWLLNEIGIKAAKTSLEKLHIQLMDDGLALGLGGLREGVSPLQMAAAYGAFANGGIYYQPHFIHKIYDRNGEVLDQSKLTHEQAFSSQTAWYMTKMLEAVVSDGTGRWGEFTGSLAGKTGTTSMEEVNGGVRDAWFAGYTPEWSGAVWMGCDRCDENNYLLEGSNIPAQLFKQILTDAYVDHASREMVFQPPAGVLDLADPIRFVAIDDLAAEVKVGWRGVDVQLQWSGSDDERLLYHVYEYGEDGITKIAEVQGEHGYTVKNVSIFSLNDYMVVPYNPQIDREGEPSNVAKAHFRFFSQSDQVS